MRAIKACLQPLYDKDYFEELKSLFHSLQEGEQLVKKIGGVFAFKVKDGPEGKEATWIVDVKNGKGSVTNDPGVYLNGRVQLTFSWPNHIYLVSWWQQYVFFLN